MLPKMRTRECDYPIVPVIPPQSKTEGRVHVAAGKGQLSTNNGTEDSPLDFPRQTLGPIRDVQERNKLAERDHHCRE